MKAYIFDVDGVIIDPKEKIIIYPEILDFLVAKLQKNELVAFNSGRSIVWLDGWVIKPLFKKIKDKSLLQNFIAVGEKGGTWVTFDKDGQPHEEEEKEFAIPFELIKETKTLVSKKYSDSMFFDGTKTTMMTIEMHDRYELSKFHERQRSFVIDLKKLLQKYGLQNLYQIDATTIATDVESMPVGKAFGVEHILRFWQGKNIDPTEFEIFGDSRSDFEMSDMLEEEDKKVRMIFVGDRERLGEINRYYQIDYFGKYSKGLLKYLQSEK